MVAFLGCCEGPPFLIQIYLRVIEHGQKSSGSTHPNKTGKASGEFFKGFHASPGLNILEMYMYMHNMEILYFNQSSRIYIHPGNMFNMFIYIMYVDEHSIYFRI